MVVIKSQIELVALDLGMQIVLRHGLQAQLTEAHERNQELLERLNTVHSPTVNGGGFAAAEGASISFPE